MHDILYISLLSASAIMLAVTTFLIIRTNSRITQILKNQETQYCLMAKTQTMLKNHSATNSVAENAEMIFQDLLQHLIPIMASIDVMPRNSTEHPLWRALGGILDTYAKNQFTLEKLRRAIKLDPEIARGVNNYINRADAFLTHLTATDPDSILSATFTDGLLGQSLTFFNQAKQLATHGDGII